MIAISLVVIGVLFILVPHFTLPLGYIKGGTGALLLSQCSIWYHPELYTGMATVLGGILSVRYKKVLLLVIAAGVMGVAEAALLRPMSYFTQSEIPLVVLSQTYSLRSHLHIREVILFLSVLVSAISGSALIFKKKKQGVQLTLSAISSANLSKRRYRSLALIISLTIVIGAFFSDILLSQSIENTLELGAGRLGADLMVVPGEEKVAAQAVLLSGGPTMFYMRTDVLNKLRRLPEIEKMSPQLYVQPFSYKVCCTIESILIIAYDPETDFTVAPWIQYSLKREQGLSDIVVGKLVKFYPGQKMDLYGKSLNVVASLEPTGLGYFDNSAFIPLEGARAMLAELKKREEAQRIPSRQAILDESFSHLFASDREKRIPIEDVDPYGISAIFVKARDGVSIKDLSNKIELLNPTIAVINVKESTVTIKRHLRSMLRAFFLPIIILLAMGTFILGIVFSMSVTERQREIGLFRAMGARKFDVFRIVLAESLIISGIGGLFGMLFGSSLVFLFKNKIMAALELLHIWPSPRVILTVFLLTVVITFSVGLLAGVYPAVRASRMEPYFAIRSGER